MRRRTCGLRYPGWPIAEGLDSFELDGSLTYFENEPIALLWYLGLTNLEIGSERNTGRARKHAPSVSRLSPSGLRMTALSPLAEVAGFDLDAFRGLPRNDARSQPKIRNVYITRIPAQ